MTKTDRSQVLRQGDVLLRPTTKTPSAAAKRITDQGRVILAYGEVTGHYHEVIASPARECASDVLYQANAAAADHDPVAPCELFEEPDGTRILVLSRPASLKHDEHSPAALDGAVNFEVIRQCEWSLDDVRQVAD